MAPQLIATNGSCVRRLLLWIAWANISFPVPLSPVISTAALCFAAIRAASIASAKICEVPMMSLKVNGVREIARSAAILFRSEDFCSWMK